MTMKSFSKKEALQFGWNVTKSNLGFFIGFLIVFVALIVVPAIISTIAMETNETNVFLGTIFYVAYYVLIFTVSMGLIKTALRFCDNEKGNFKDLFSQYPLFFKYLAGYILYFLIVWVGTILFIVPGIIWGIRFWFFDYLIIDKKIGPIEALKKSSAITKGQKWNLFVFFLMVTGVNLLGAIALLIGLFVTVPTTMVATAFVYRKLLSQSEMISAPEVSPVGIS